MNGDDQAYDWSPSHTKTAQFSDIRLQLFTRFFFFFPFPLQDQPSLPITNNALAGLVPSPLPKDTTLHRRMFKFLRETHNF